MEFLSLISYLFAPLIICSTLLGSTIGILVFARPNMKKIGPANIYKFLFAIEYLNLIILIDYLPDNFEIKLLDLSTSTCKIFSIVFFVYMQIPPMLLVYISIERFVSIAYPSKRLFLRRNNIQLIYFLGLIFYNCFLYLFMLFYTNLITKIDAPSNRTYIICDFENQIAYSYFYFIDLTNRVVIPFILMAIMTTLLIRQIYLSRKKFSTKQSDRKRSFNRDVRLSVSIASLNLVYLCFCLPFSIYSFFFEYILVYQKIYFLLEYVNFFYYASDFYLVLATNFLVRKEIRLIYKMFIRLFNK